jgi:hypothetical protein
LCSSSSRKYEFEPSGGYKCLFSGLGCPWTLTLLVRRRCDLDTVASAAVLEEATFCYSALVTPLPYSASILSSECRVWARVSKDVAITSILVADFLESSGTLDHRPKRGMSGREAPSKPQAHELICGRGEGVKKGMAVLNGVVVLRAISHLRQRSSSSSKGTTRCTPTSRRHAN